MVNADYLFKIMVLGESNVGKTNIITRYVDGRFNAEHKITVGVDISIKDVPDVKGLDGKPYSVKLQLWNLGSQGRGGCVCDEYYQCAAGGLLVYDITNEETFQKAYNWLFEANRNTPDIAIILVGNKVDLEDQRKVPREAVEGWATQYGLGYSETSAKNNININETFYLLAQACLYYAILQK